MKQSKTINPFDSDYADKKLIGQQIGNRSYYPKTEDLSDLHRALSIEFRTALPQHIARVDHRGSDFDKLMLYTAVTVFCCHTNAHRPDQIRMHPHFESVDGCWNWNMPA